MESGKERKLGRGDGGERSSVCVREGGGGGMKDWLDFPRNPRNK